MINNQVKDWQGKTLTHLNRLENLFTKENILDRAVLNIINTCYPMLSDNDKLSVDPFIQAYRNFLEEGGEALVDLGNDILFVDSLLVLIGDEDGRLLE